MPRSVIAYLSGKKAEKMMLAFAESIQAISHSFFGLADCPQCFGKLFRIDTSPALAGKIRVILEPTNRCAKLFAALRALERQVLFVQQARHKHSSPKRQEAE